MRRALLLILVLPSLLFAVQPDAVRVRPAAAVLAPAGEVLVADEAFSQVDSSVASIGHSTLVVWTDGYRVKAQAFGRTLQPIGERLELIAGTPVPRLTLVTNGDTYLLLGSEAGSPALAWQISSAGALLGGPHDTGIRSEEEASIRWNGEAYEVVFGERNFDRRLLAENGAPAGPIERVLDISRSENGIAPQWAVGDGRLTLSFLGRKPVSGIPEATPFAWVPSLMFADGRIIQNNPVWAGFPQPAHVLADGPVGSLFVWSNGQGAVARRFDARGETSDPIEGIQITRVDRRATALHLFPAGRDFLLVYEQQTSVKGHLLSDVEAVVISLETGAGAPFAIAADAEENEFLDEAIMHGTRLLVSYRVAGALTGTKITLRSLQMPSARQRGVRR